jgi:hypothetical protein
VVVGVEAELVRRTPSGDIVPWYLNEDGTDPVKDTAVLAKLDELIDAVTVPHRLLYFQPEAMAVWTIVHNLGFMPNVTTVDSSGRAVRGAVQYLDLNTVQITFSDPFTGAAFLS